jgi:hypothetical protein
MSGIANILKEMRSNPKGVRFSDLKKVCEHYFGLPGNMAQAIVFTKRLGQGIPE